MRRTALWIGSLALSGLLLSSAGVSGQCSSYPKTNTSCPSSACIGAAAGAVMGAQGSFAGGLSGGAAGSSCSGVVPAGYYVEVPPTLVPPAPAAKPADSVEKKASHDRLVKELLDIMNDTSSVDTFCVVLGCLERTKVDCDLVVPAIIKNAERLGLLKDLMSKDGPNEEQKRLCEILDQIMKSATTGHKKAVKKDLPPPPCCSTCPTTGPAPCYGSGGLPSERYLQYVPQYVPPTNDLPSLTQGGVPRDRIVEIDASLQIRGLPPWSARRVSSLFLS